MSNSSFDWIDVVWTNFHEVDQKETDQHHKMETDLENFSSNDVET